MSVVVITNLFPNPLEPMRSTFNEQQVLALNKVLRVSAVVAPIDWRRMLNFKREGRQGNLLAQKEWKSIPVSYPVFFYIPKVASWLNGPLMFFSLLPQWMRVKREKPEAIYATWAFPDGFAAVLLAKMSGIRVVVKVHGTDVEVLGSHLIRRVLAVWALNRASAVVSVSAYLRDMLVDLGVQPKKLTVIYNGVDGEKFRALDRTACRVKLNLPITKKIILYIGNLKSDKGVVDLVKSFAIVAAGNSNVMLVYAGDGVARAEIERLNSPNGLGEPVRFLGKVSHDALPEWINAADVLCLPSHHEGVPNVLLEAASCGTPCVATTVGGIPEVVTPASGLLVAPGDVAALARALIDALARDWNRDEIRTAVKTGTWMQNATQLAAVIQGGDRI
jgi:glycosyltransferase involved in cell wall biosynthesis